MSTKGKNSNLPRALGLLLSLFGGLVAIGAAIFVSHDAAFLWALLLLGVLAERFKSADSSPYMWHPLILGGTIFAMCVGLAAVIFFTTTPVALWALILVGIVADYIV